MYLAINLSSFPINLKTNKHYSKILFGKASLQKLQFRFSNQLQLRFSTYFSRKISQFIFSNPIVSLSSTSRVSLTISSLPHHLVCLQPLITLVLYRAPQFIFSSLPHLQTLSIRSNLSKCTAHEQYGDSTIPTNTFDVKVNQKKKRMRLTDLNVFSLTLKMQCLCFRFANLCLIIWLISSLIAIICLVCEMSPTCRANYVVY